MKVNGSKDREHILVLFIMLMVVSMLVIGMLIINMGLLSLLMNMVRLLKLFLRMIGNCILLRLLMKNLRINNCHKCKAIHRNRINQWFKQGSQKKKENKRK